MCEILDSVYDVNKEVYFLGDLNIDWFIKLSATNQLLAGIQEAIS